MATVNRIDDELLLDWIDGFVVDNRYAPSVREAADFLGLNVSTAHARLERLREQGYITWNEGETRTLRIVGTHHGKSQSDGRGGVSSLSLQRS